jgi:hypothetical protein
MSEQIETKICQKKWTKWIQDVTTWQPLHRMLNPSTTKFVVHKQIIFFKDFYVLKTQTSQHFLGCSVAQFGVQRSSVLSTLDCCCPVLGLILTWWLLISSPGFVSHPVDPPPPVQPRSRSYHSATSGPALDDSRDEYYIIKYA